jgi:hypothetical protein
MLGDFEPSSPYQLSGLGLSIAEAHQQFLTRYQRQTENGLWHSLENDGYVYNQLIWHLEKAGKIGEIHQLLREETAEGGNGLTDGHKWVKARRDRGCQKRKNLSN